ncbi:MAG: hypothetical protein ACI4RP_09720 [Acutalibacteraceae bacterium]
MDEREVKKISVEYDNGEIEEITKGFIAGFSNIDEVAGTVRVIFQMCDITGEDLEMIVCSVAELADKLGMFKEAEQK